MTVMQTKASMLLESASKAVEQVRVRDPRSRQLSGHRMLRSLKSPELSRLVASGTWVDFAEGEIASQQGNAVETVMFVAEGNAKAEIAAPERGAYRAVVNFIGPGDDIGMLSLVDGAPHSATVTALKPMRALDVPAGLLEEYLRAHPEWYRSIAEVAVSRLRTSSLWVQALI